MKETGARRTGQSGIGDPHLNSTNHKSKVKNQKCPAFLLCLACLLGLGASTVAEGAVRRSRRGRRRRGASEDATRDYKANDMLNRGVELLGVKQEERGLKLVSSVPRMFPTSPVRFKAYLCLGKYHADKRRF